MKTWEVKLETSNGQQILTEVVSADDWDTVSAGLIFFSTDDSGARADVAFYPYTRLVGVRDTRGAP